MAGNGPVVTDRNARRRMRDRRNAPERAAARRERYETRTPAEKAADRERRRRSRQTRRAARLAEYLTVHGTLPACACGCGEPVEFGDNYPNRYRYHHNPPAADALIIEYSGERVPIDRARPALERLRRQHGWTISQMAALGGMPRGTLWAILRKPGYADRFGVDADLLRSLLRRLAGLGERADTRELKRINARYQSTDVDRYR
jgi:hypothetical protein